MERIARFGDLGCEGGAMPRSACLARGASGMYAYCVFCNTLKRERLGEAIRLRLGVEVVVPKIVQRKWVKGKAVEVVHDYLPGYLFLYAEAPVEDFGFLFHLEDVYRVLGERENGHCLTGSDLAFARMMHDCGGTIGVLKTCRIGDRVRMAEGAMGGVDGEIIRLDRRGRALVRFSFDGANIQSWVAIERIDDGPKTLLPLNQNDGDVSRK